MTVVSFRAASLIIGETPCMTLCLTWDYNGFFSVSYLIYLGDTLYASKFPVNKTSSFGCFVDASMSLNRAIGMALLYVPSL